MRAMGLRETVRGRAFRVTTEADLGAVRPPDLVQREFRAELPNQLWVADLTATWAGFVYVAFVIDVFAPSIVGRRVSSSPRSDYQPQGGDATSGASPPSMPRAVMKVIRTLGLEFRRAAAKG